MGFDTEDPTPVLQGVEVYCVSPEASGYILKGLPETVARSPQSLVYPPG